MTFTIFWELGSEVKFQLTRSRGAWQFFLYNTDTEEKFQLTRSRGAWHTTGAGTAIVFNFNSHAHVERDNLPQFLLNSYHYFNSHAHVERDVEFSMFLKVYSHFNSHAHVERDYLRQVLSELSLTISTHTLTWSVTYPMQPFTKTHIISTHTLTWSVTGAFVPFTNSDWYFNSHAHVERDTTDFRMAYDSTTFQLTRSRGAWLLHLLTCCHQLSISTHTLTWSVT